MTIFDKSKDKFASSPIRVPKRIKSIKRWRINITDLENYIEYDTKYSIKESDINKVS